MPKAALTPRMISDFCRLRLVKVLEESERSAVCKYLTDLLDLLAFPPYRGRWIDWAQVGVAAGIEKDRLQAARHQLQPVFDAVSRAVSMEDVAPSLWTPPKDILTAKTPKIRSQSRSEAYAAADKPATRRRGPKPKVIVEFPEPLWTEWEEPETLSEALNLHMRRHGDTVRHLFLALDSNGNAQDQRTLMKWCTGQLVPRTVQSLAVLAKIERRYRLADGYFKSKMPNRGRANYGHILEGISSHERRRLAWHLPDDFLSRSKSEQDEILTWVRRVIITGSTDYRRYQAEAMKQKYAVRFTAFMGRRRKPGTANDNLDVDLDDLDAELESAVVEAPAALDREMKELLRFKTATLTAFGLQRNGVWNEETASQKVEHLSLMFGSLASDPRSTVKGCGVPLDSLCFAMLVFPAVWDWYLQWRERRRGFYTKWEVDMLSVVLGMTRADTGWIRQTPALADRLRPIPGLISEHDIKVARKDWDAACETFHKHARHRIKEIQRVARIHRDPFEPILPVLESDSPVGEYRKITEEIVRLMPDERRYPRAAAEAVRSFLLLRLGMHLGLRQRNLRELLVCPRGRMPTSERHLEEAPLHLARLICQRTNLRYDSQLRRYYSGLLIGLAAAVAVLVGGVGLFQSLSFPQWVLTLASLSPLLSWSIREYYRQQDTADQLEDLMKSAKKLWELALSGECLEPECTLKTREFQDAIYARRVSSPLIVPLIYKLSRSYLEDEMNNAANDFLSQYLDSETMRVK